MNNQPICQFELQTKHFGFADCTAENFYVSQWGKNKTAFFAYRFFAFTYALAWLIADLANKHHSRWEMYLTNWTIVCGCLFYFLAVCVTAYGVMQQRSNNQELQWFHKIEWIVYETALTGSLVTDLLYWGLLSGSLSPEEIKDPFNIYAHALNYSMLLFDLMINDIPVRFLHFVHPVAYSVVYIIFSLILHAARITSAVYSVLDWKNEPGKAVMYVVPSVVIAVPAAHAFNCGCCRLRIFVAKKRERIVEPAHGEYNQEESELQTD